MPSYVPPVTWAVSWTVVPSLPFGMLPIATAGATASGRARTTDVSLSVAVSLVPSAALVPVPLTVTVSCAVTFVLAATLGRVHVGDAKAGSFRVPLLTVQA